MEISLSSGLNALALSLSCYAMISIFVIGIIVFACLESYGTGKKDIMDGLILDEKQRNRDGYTGSKDKTDLIGAIAVCSTDLRPAGTVIVEGEPFDVVTEGDFVKKGDIVKVINVEGSRVVVRRI